MIWYTALAADRKLLLYGICSHFQSKDIAPARSYYSYAAVSLQIDGIPSLEETTLPNRSGTPVPCKCCPLLLAAMIRKWPSNSLDFYASFFFNFRRLSKTSRVQAAITLQWYR